MVNKLNCWEYKKCGRDPHGKNVNELGVCPTAVERRVNGIHGGENAGRCCWVVTGTLCTGKVQGSFAQKYENCEICDFYRSVRQEEGAKFVLGITILNILRKNK